MKPKVKEVSRTVLNRECTTSHWSTEAHPLRDSITFAKMDDGSLVDLPEDQILSYFGRKRFSDKLLEELEMKLKGKSLSYKSTRSGNVLDGDIEDYL